MRYGLSFSLFMVGAMAGQAEPEKEPKLIVKPEAFKTLVNPPCSHCRDEAKRRAKELSQLDAVKKRTHVASRLGQIADVVVVGGGATRRGLTEDYLEVDLVDSHRARGERADVVLEMRAGTLVGSVPSL